jgi:hypothetical protein
MLQAPPRSKFSKGIIFSIGLVLALTSVQLPTANASATTIGQTPVADNQHWGIAYGNGLFVAVAITGNGDRVMTSPDGITWTSRTSAADNQWYGITYGNGLFVAVAFSGTNNRIMTSPDGITWTTQTSPANINWSGVTYGNGIFVAVANTSISTGDTRMAMTSPDGVTWTLRTTAVANAWYSVAFGNGLFVAVSNNGTGNRVMTSPDGINWTIRSSAADNLWYSVTYGNGRFVAVAGSGSGNRVMTSTNGINWTTSNTPVDSVWYSVTFGNGYFVAVANSGAGHRIMFSADGITWTSRAAAEANGWQAVTYGDGKFVAVATSGTRTRAMVISFTPIYDFQAANYNATTGEWTNTGSVPGDGSVSVTAKIAGRPLKNSTPASVEFNGATNGYQFINETRETNAVNQAFTISVWFKTATPERKIVGFEGHNEAEKSEGYDKNLFIDATGKLVFATQNVKRITTTGTVTNNQWHHAVATYTGTTTPGATSNEIKLYLNDALIGTLGSASALQATGYWRIGGFMMAGWQNSGYYSGSIGQVSIFDWAISQTEAQTIYANTRSTYQTPTPTFGTPIATANGFTVQISNYDAAFTWAGTATASGSVSISDTGLVTVTGVAPLTSSTATITSSRTGYSNGTATVSETSTTGAGLTPTFGSPAATADGFTVSITNYDAAFTWATPTVSSGSVAITSTSGATRVLTVTVLSPGATATITQNTTRTGYSNGTGTVSGTATARTQTTAADNSAAQAEAAKKQKELLELLSIIPSLGSIALNLGETTKTLTLQKCAKKKDIRYVKKGAKCPKGFVRKR